jgi:serine/threonine protein kinase/tetratricopeptide (TPR) repeat protein
MAGDPEGAARKAQDGIAVSSGDSSAATPRPALGSEGLTDPGFQNPDVTSPGTDLPTTPKSDPSDAVTMTGAPGPGSGSVPHPIFSAIGATVFHQGDILGGRYEIQKLLGMGGMGAVYKARDMEVERVVGLKVIRPDLAGDPAILARFKQELILARQVTHKNIIRIYDLNEADGVKFITMEFIEGEDLRSILLREGKLAPQKAAAIMVQVCAGLLAAHSEGVIHRDLKPSNVMCDQAGRVVIMDFGLARTVQGDGMTRTGMMVGTMEYMSPEQAMGKELDARSDQFAAGIIFYELLSGIIPYRADSAIASLVKRTQESAVPLTEVDPTIPPELSAIVGKCLERDPAARFASIQELIDEIEIWQGKKRRVGQSVLDRPVLKPVAPKRLPIKWIAVGVAAIALSAGTYFVIHNRTQQGSGGSGPPVVKGPVTSVAILPFYNSTGDPTEDWVGSVISQNLIDKIGQSVHLHLVSAGRVEDLRISPAAEVDSSTLKSIKVATNADTVISGQLVKAGNQFHINAVVYDLKDGRGVPVGVDFANTKDDLTSALDKLAKEVREKLASTPDIRKELQANSGHVLTKSVPALQAYYEGLQLTRAGKDTEAISKFDKATQVDSNFAMAFVRLAQTYANLGRDVDAQNASRTAVELSNNLPSESDRYLIEANDADINNNLKKAIPSYEKLTQLSPADTDLQLSLAKLYMRDGKYDDARKRLDIVLAADPNYVDALWVSGRVYILAENPQDALVPLNNGLSLATISGNLKQKADFLHALGVSYQHLKKYDDALQNYQKALGIRNKIPDMHGVIMTLNQIAQTQESMGDANAALASYKQAITIARSLQSKNGLALSLMDRGDLYNNFGNYDEALRDTKEALQEFKDLDDKSNEAMCLNNIANSYNYKGDYLNASTYFQQAHELQIQEGQRGDAIESLRNRAEMNFKLGEYATAQDLFQQAATASKDAGRQDMLAMSYSSMGALLAAQAKYDAALSDLNDAMKGLQGIDDRTWYSVQAKARYGDVLSIVGQGAEGQKYADQARELSATLRGNSATPEAWNSVGDSYFYRGDYGQARSAYEKARQALGKWVGSDQGLRARLGLARVSLEAGRTQAALPELKKIKDEAASMGLKALAVQASISYAQALLAANRAEPAQQELETTLGQIDKLGLLLERARAEFLLGNAMIQAGKAKEAPHHYQEAVLTLDAIVKKEKSAAHLLDRPDLKVIYGEAKASSIGGSS